MSWVIAWLVGRLSTFGPVDPRRISVRSEVQIFPDALGKYKSRKVLRPSEFSCYTLGLRAITLAVTSAWFLGGLYGILWRR